MSVRRNNRNTGARLWSTACLILFLFVADLAGTFTAANNWMQAQRFAWAKTSTDTNIVVVGIDSGSIAKYGQWPWPRNIHAQIIEKLVEADANQIAFDVDFSSSTSPAEDDALETALKLSKGSTILAGFKQGDGLRQRDTVPLERFSAQAWIASVSVHVDEDGVVRRVPLQENLAGQNTPSLASYLAQSSSSGPGEINIDFAISPESFPVVSVADLLDNKIPKSFLAGKDVIVGATAVELRDLFVTPLGDVVPGSVLQSLAAETTRQHRSLSTPAVPTRMGILFLIGFIGLFAASRTWAEKLLIYGSLLIGLEWAATTLQSRAFLFLPTVSWSIALAGLAVIATFAELDFRKLWISRIQTRLGATKALLREIISDSPAGVIVIDDSDRIRVANHVATRILGVPGADWIGLSARDVLPPQITQLFESSNGSTSPTDQGQLELQLPDTLKVLEYSLTTSVVADEAHGAEPTLARCLTFQDVTERRETMRRLAYLALHDPVTDTKNWNCFVQDLDKLAVDANDIAVIHLGIDRFKYINEDFGQVTGDLLLVSLAARARSMLGDNGELYRLAGDEFACVLQSGKPGSKVHELAEQLHALGTPTAVGGYEVAFAVSLGISMASAGEWNSTEIIRRCDLALASAKLNGGNRICIFDEALDEVAKRRKSLETALAGALQREEFHLLYQPQFELATGRCVGVEALLRWTSPALGSISPTEFIPVLEQVGAIEEVGSWALQKACREISPLSANVGVAVNVSLRQLLHSNFTGIVDQALANSNLAAQRLEIEVTESVLAENTQQVGKVLQSLRDRGVAVALDDFGTGYSSLSYLLNLPLDRIKIDKAFVTNLPADGKTSALVTSILGVAKALGLTAIAEGIETLEQWKSLDKAGCQQGQGYLYAKPMGLEALKMFLHIKNFDLSLRSSSVPSDPPDVYMLPDQATRSTA